MVNTKEIPRVIQFTPAKLKRLKARYQRATTMDVSSFIFDGDEYLVSYAYYLIGFLEENFRVGQKTTSKRR